MSDNSMKQKGGGGRNKRRNNKKPKKNNNRKAADNQRLFARQLQIWDYLLNVDVPMFAHSSDFRIVSKPEGTRCLLLSGKGATIARDHRGCIVAKFQSGLPGGREDEAATDKCCVLDCIFNKQTGAYFVLDLLQWNDVSYREFPLAVRLIQIEQNLAEIGSRLDESTRAKLKIVKYHECNA